MIKLLLCLFLLNAPELNKDSVLTEQSILNKMQDLPDFTFRAKKLTAADVIDSVLHYETNNYYYPAAFSGRITGTLIKGKDTAFRAVTDSVYFCRRSNKKTSYDPRISQVNTPEVTHNKLDSSSRNRIMNIEGFPPLKDFHTFVKKFKPNIQKNEALFGVSKENGTTMHHILIKNKVDGDDVGSSYLHLAINRDSWKLMKVELCIFDLKDSIVPLLTNTRSCKQAIDLLDKEMKSSKGKLLRYCLEYKQSTNQKLVPSHLAFQNSLLHIKLFSSKQHELEDQTTYWYEQEFSDVMQESPEGKLKSFSTIDWKIAAYTL